MYPPSMSLMGIEMGPCLFQGSSRNFILGGGGEAHGSRDHKSTGRLHNYNILGGGGGELRQFGREVELFGGGGGGSFPCAPLLR